MVNFNKKLIFSLLFLCLSFIIASPSLVLAADNNGTYQSQLDAWKTCNNEKVGEDYIRVQIPIPGLTSESCPKPILALNDKGQLEVKSTTIYYVESLPKFIEKVYTFSIGVIAIIAVLMIMVAGLQWIFAAGNPGKIGEAKSSITAALTGLVLAFLSYAILNAINPRLTTIELKGLTKVKTIEQANYWCRDFFNENGTLKSGIKITDSSGGNISGTGECGKKYIVKVEKGEATENSCYGDICTDKKLECLKMSSSTGPRCYDAKTLCESMRNNCDSLNVSLTISDKNTCRQKRVDVLTDGNCKWATRWPLMGYYFSENYKTQENKTQYSTINAMIIGNTGNRILQRVNCSVSQFCANNKDCNDSNYANIGADHICAQGAEKGTITCSSEKPATSVIIGDYIKVNCNDYMNQGDNFASGGGTCSLNCWAPILLLKRN